MSRGNQKHEREAVKLAEAIAPGSRAHIEARRRHCWLVLRVREQEVRISLSCSPSDAGQALNHTRQNIQRALREKGITL
jgi:hypothetical protein